jgi:F-type H+-transporting ATPase subunit b
MPQLDKVTFLSQFFWLCFFYLGFYYMILKFYLPKISRILALRRKKMGFSHEGMISLQQENNKVRENYEILLSRALVTSKSLFNSFFSRTTTWLNTNALAITRTHYQNVNKSFIHTLGETSLSQNLLFYHAANHLPEKLTLKLLINNLNNKGFSLFSTKSQGRFSANKLENLSQDNKKMKKSKKS